MKGLIGRKVGMTSIYLPNGHNVACTVVEAGPCVVTQVKTKETDGYNALQLGFGEKKAKNTTQPLQKHFENASTTPKAEVKEFRDFSIGKKLGETITVTDVFAEGEHVSVTGTSKGKGFQGVVKRYGFSGVGGRTHGQHNRGRHPGSIGASSYPSKVFKGQRMAGHTGNEQVTVHKLQLVKLFPEKNLLLIKGAIPGHNGSFVIVKKK